MKEISSDKTSIEIIFFIKSGFIMNKIF